MTTNPNNPWSQLAKPEDPSKMVIRLVDPEQTYSFHWGMDYFGKCMLVLRLEGNHFDVYNQKNIKASGIETKYVETEPDHQAFILYLGNNEDKDIFLRLCNAIIASASSAENQQNALILSLEEIKRWKLFLAGKKKKLLSLNEIRGLFGELHVIKSIVESGYSSPSMAIESWIGPMDGIQDFEFTDHNIEVKTIVGKKKSVHITSENQLLSDKDKLYLSVVHLQECQDGSDGVSLNGMIKTLFDSFPESSRGQFENRLANAGYIELPEYDYPTFLVEDSTEYLVSDAFPKVTSDELPEAIHKVSYELKTEFISDFISHDLLYLRSKR